MPPDASTRSALPERAIILAGFMGTGKSTVGPLLARMLGRSFVDLDDLIEELAGRAIPALFDEGEEEFRWWEQYALGRLDLTQPLVVATGGGALVGRWNQARAAKAQVVVLDAPLDVVRERLGESEGRPLVPHLERLYGRRFAAYGRLPLHVETRDRSPRQVANEIIRCLMTLPVAEATENPHGEMLRVRTPGGGEYPIHIQAGVAAGVGGWVAQLGARNVALITDSSVAPFWGEATRHDLMAARLRCTLIEFPQGERHKTLATVSQLYDSLHEAGIDRGGAVVALGGGVVGDVAGFVAATWMRGVRRFVQLPTTLVSMVDASVGGKTGVDHPRGKNLIGAFRHPDLVLIDPHFLATLPERELRGGMAEVIKHGVIGDPALFKEVEGWREAGSEKERLLERLSPTLLARAVRVKTRIVSRDPEERGERALLNLGHTFGHAYELLSGYAISHGEAVSLGMVTAARLSEALGVAERGLAARIAATLAGIGLPTRWDGAPGGDAVWKAMQSDKKKSAGGLRFVLPRAIGEVFVTAPGEIDRRMVLEAIDAQHRKERSSVDV